MNDGKFIQEVHGYVSWAKNGAFKEKHCANKIIEAAKAYADAQVAAKDAEIKRLRDGVNSALYGLRATHAMSKDDSRRMRKVGSVLKSLLSRAPVTESRPPISLQMYKCNNCQWRGQVGESIETESFDICPECKSDDLML